jgi:hypothetical protein
MSMLRFVVILVICSLAALADEPVGTKIHGTVLLPDGTPAEKTATAMATHGQGFVHIEEGYVRQHNGRERYYTLTNKEGRFEFAPIDFEKEGRQRFNMFLQMQPQGEFVDFILVFLHDAGFKRLTQQDWEALDESKTITLEPWGRIEGTVMVGTQPGKNLPLLCYVQFNNGFGSSPFDPHVMISYSATANASGDFTIERVPPSFVRVSRKIEYNIAFNEKGQRSSVTFTGSHSSDVIELLPDASEYVQIGGVGRPVIGKIVPSKEFETPPELAFVHVTCFRKPEDVGDIDFDPAIIRQKLITKDVIEAGIPSNQLEWMNWLLSPAGKQYEADVEKAINEAAEVQTRRIDEFYKRRLCTVAKDGTFRLDDIPEGDCILQVVIEDPAGGQPGIRQTIGLLDDYEFQVPAVQGGVSDEPPDLGTLEVEPNPGGNVPVLPAALR